MTKDDITLLEQVWLRFTGETFSPQQLARQVRQDGGVDIMHLSDEDILQLMSGQYYGDWHKAAFTFSEMLACYSCITEGLAPKETVAWIFTVFVLADALHQNVTEIGFQFNSFIRSVLLVKETLNQDESIYICWRFFSAIPESDARITWVPA